MTTFNSVWDAIEKTFFDEYLFHRVDSVSKLLGDPGYRLMAHKVYLSA